MSSLLLSLLSLVAPLLIGPLFDDIIPNASFHELRYFVLAIFIVAVSSLLLTIAQTLSIARITQQLVHTFQSTVLNKLVSLGPQFFRQFTSSDLAFRALSVDHIRQVLSNTVLSSMFLSVFSITYWIGLFFIDVKLACVVSVLLIIQIVTLSILYRMQIIALTQEGAANSRSLSWLYDAWGGIAKIRVAGAEQRLFDRWQGLLQGQIQSGERVGHIATAMTTFSSVFQLVLFAVMIVVVAYTRPHYLSVGGFLSFGALLIGLTSSISKLNDWVSIGLSVVPMYRSLKPIMDATPEVTGQKRDLGELSGLISLEDVSFCYDAAKPILSNINLTVKPGQFVAIVGPSGAGKSTLLRLLLGFEEATSGHVLYDGQDLATLNIMQVRRQLGVVLQNGKLFPGSILDNIIGSSLLSIEDAWYAAKLCGLDEDIQAMPMGMQTLVNMSGNSISGGQRQRILIARALVRKPKILLFDEATSALDNQTQKIVTDSLDALQVTRIVIAHRLSTIRHADAIYVLDAGRFVESGTFEELMSKNGVFAQLAKRQV